jgi:hypothetical protein
MLFPTCSQCCAGGSGFGAGSYIMETHYGEYLTKTFLILLFLIFLGYGNIELQYCVYNYKCICSVFQDEETLHVGYLVNEPVFDLEMTHIPQWCTIIYISHKETVQT